MTLITSWAFGTAKNKIIHYSTKEFALAKLQNHPFLGSLVFYVRFLGPLIAPFFLFFSSFLLRGSVRNEDIYIYIYVCSSSCWSLTLEAFKDQKPLLSFNQAKRVCVCELTPFNSLSSRRGNCM